MGEAAPTPEIDGLTDLVEIGRGGFSTVYSARQLLLDRSVAVKVLDLPPAESRRFEREAAALGRLSGMPRVVQVHAVLRTADGRPAIVMELMASSLAEAATDPAGLDGHRVLGWLDDVAAALDEAHRRGVHHRDVKPGNILVGRDGRAYLADFGIAGLQEIAASTSTAMSFSPPFAPPERLTGAPDDPVRGDIYSLAASFFAVLTGRAPFGTTTEGGIHGLVLRVVANQVEQPASMDDATFEVFRSAMSAEPANRPPTAEEFARSLRRALPAGTVAPPTVVDGDDDATTVERLPVDQTVVRLAPPAEPTVVRASSAIASPADDMDLAVPQAPVGSIGDAEAASVDDGDTTAVAPPTFGRRVGAALVSFLVLIVAMAGLVKVTDAVYLTDLGNARATAEIGERKFGEESGPPRFTTFIPPTGWSGTDISRIGPMKVMNASDTPMTFRSFVEDLSDNDEAEFAAAARRGLASTVDVLPGDTGILELPCSGAIISQQDAGCVVDVVAAGLAGGRDYIDPYESEAVPGLIWQSVVLISLESALLVGVLGWIGALIAAVRTFGVLYLTIPSSEVLDGGAAAASVWIGVLGLVILLVVVELVVPAVRGATLGQLALGITHDSDRPGRSAVQRWLLRMAVRPFSTLLVGAGYWLRASESHDLPRRTWHDRAAGLIPRRRPTRLDRPRP